MGGDRAAFAFCGAKPSASPRAMLPRDLGDRDRGDTVGFSGDFAAAGFAAGSETGVAAAADAGGSGAAAVPDASTRAAAVCLPARKGLELTLGGAVCGGAVGGGRPNGAFMGGAGMARLPNAAGRSDSVTSERRVAGADSL